MAKTIKQIADELQVSKQAVFKKIDNLGLRSKLTVDVNQFTVDEKQEMLIKSAFMKNSPSTKGVNQVDDTVNQSVNQVDGMNRLIDMLQKELDSKNKVIEEQAETIKKQAETISQLSGTVSAAQALHAGTIQQQIMSEQKSEEITAAPEKPKGFFAKLFGK